MAPRIDTIAHGLIAIRAQVDMLLSIIEPDSAMPPPPDPGPCEHMRTKPSPDSTMGNLHYICEDCGEEVKT